MSERKDLVKLAKDIYKNRFSHDKYSTKDANEVLRNALVELNGGSTKIDFKTLRRHKIEMFELIEEILENTILEGLPDDNFFKQFVDYKNLKLGDKNLFYVPDNTMLVVSEIADGTTDLRRQRLDVGGYTSIPTSWKGVKVYEHLTRLLSGRVDFDEMLDALEEAFRVRMNDEIYNAFVGSFNSLPIEFVTSGAFDEDALIEIIEHVEAASGKSAIIAGTRKALRKVKTAVEAESAKEDMYKMGYYGTFAGTPMVRIKQVHNVGTFDFKLSDNDIYVVTTDEKPIKVVNEGEVRILSNDAMNNVDLTQDYLSAMRYGVGVVVTDLYGKYNISS